MEAEIVKFCMWVGKLGTYRRSRGFSSRKFHSYTPVRNIYDFFMTPYKRLLAGDYKTSYGSKFSNSTYDVHKKI